MSTIQERFEAFDQANPQVYERIVQLAADWDERTNGRRISIETFFGHMRWEENMKIERTSEFKLNDHFTSRYVRKLLRDHPQFMTMFETRRLRSR